MVSATPAQHGTGAAMIFSPIEDFLTHLIGYSLLSCFILLMWMAIDDALNG
jgi:hypothetical protein